MRNAECGISRTRMAGCCGSKGSHGAPLFVMGEGEGSKVRFYGKNQLLVFVRVEKQIKVTSIAFPE